MIIHSLKAQNYRPFSVLHEIRLGSLATIVGQNDAGKSNILRALQLFFDPRPKVDESDVHDGAASSDDIVIEVSFALLPEAIELEDDVSTSLQDERLVDEEGYLRIRKIFPRSNLSKPSIQLITHDFEDDQFSFLPKLKEKDLNERCASTGIDVTKSGRGITNKSKRQALRDRAREQGVPVATRELPLTSNDDLWKRISDQLPEFVLFETDTRLGVGETSFQSQFRPVVKAAAEQPKVVDARNDFTGAIGEALQEEIDEVFERLAQHTDEFTGLSVRPSFSWDKAVTFEILSKDQYGVETSIDRRGSGMRRLLMVAFFQYLAERGRDRKGDFIFAIEEPENCLHPGLQRELVTSFRRLAEEGFQIMVTSHSPVFAGSSPIEDLALIVREAGVARGLQTPNLDLLQIAEQLGVEPSDQITGYNACIFVEGPTDIEFWKAVTTKLKNAGHVQRDFSDDRIGFVLCGGETLKYWIDLRAMSRLNRHFGVVVDSDRRSPEHNIPGRKLNWKNKCEEQGGIFFILRKREIENYLHRDAIQRSGRAIAEFDDFTDMKATFGENVYKVIHDMSADEILERDYYERNDGSEHHELLEIAKVFLDLPQG